MRFLIPLFLLVNFVYAKTNIVVSILPQQTFVEKIGGEKVNLIASKFSDKSAKVIADELKIKVIKETPLATNWSQNLIHVANTIANNN